MASDATYQDGIQLKQGGKELAVAPGAQITIAAGATLDVSAGTLVPGVNSLADGAVGASDIIADGVVTPAHFAPDPGDGSTAGVPVVYSVEIPNTAGSTTLTIPTDSGVRILDVWTIKEGGTGGSGDTITVKNGATAVTNAIALNSVAAKAITRATTIDTAQTNVAAAGTIVITAAKVTDCSCRVCILCDRI